MVALEEINWGQFIFNWETPDSFKKWNTQDGIGFHNHIAIQSYVHIVPFLVVGILGLSAVRFGHALNGVTGGNLAFFLPPAPFTLFFILMLINGIVVLIFDFDAAVLGNSYFSWDGLDRYLEINELGIAFGAFCYAYTRHLLLPARAIKAHQLWAAGKRIAAGARFSGGGGGGKSASSPPRCPSCFRCGSPQCSA